MRSSEFIAFLSLAEDREPIFREVLATANDMAKKVFQDQILCAKTATSHPRNLLPSPLSGLDTLETTTSIMCGFEIVIGAGDAYSGLDLDTLLAYSFRQGREGKEGQQLTDIVDQCDLWRSTRFEDADGVDERPTWTPRLQRSQRRPRCYQLLPFYDSGRWQLAVFDIMKKVIVCYDTIWTSGSSNSTFLVGQALCVCSGLQANPGPQLLQQWFSATVYTKEVVFNCHHEKVSRSYRASVAD